MSEELSAGPWSCEGAGHCTGGLCSSLGGVAVWCEAELDFTFFSVHHFIPECPTSHFSSGFVQWPVPVTQGQWLSENIQGKRPREEQFISL